MTARIIKQLNTEKTHKLGESSVYCFLVSKQSRKDEIKKMVENTFGVKVVAVNTTNTKRKNKTFRGVSGTTTNYKKAYITLTKGSKIEVDSAVKEG